MRTIQRIPGAYAFLLVLAVAVHFVVTPVYDDGTTGYRVWAAFDWFMAPAVVLACAASLVWKLDLSNGGAEIPDARRSLEVNTLFYSSLVLGLWFLSKLVRRPGGPRGPAAVVVHRPVVCRGHRRLWRSAAS